MIRQDKVTSLDVARRAGVSQSAVSRAFSKRSSISDEMARRVHKAASELGYRPNVIARSLITGKSRIIGLVVGYLDNHFYPDAVEQLSNKLQEKGYHLLIFMTRQTAGDVDHVIEEIMDYQVDAIITASVALSSELADRCQASGLPVVQFNRTQFEPGFSSVTADNIGGGAKLADLLVETGHESFGYIAGWEGASTQRDREAGFVNKLAEKGQMLSHRLVADFDQKKAAEAARQMMRDKNPPDCIFVANDFMAFAVMDVCRFELGLSVPDDVSIVGFDDVPAAAWPSYDLTTIRQSAELMAAQTVALLLAQIEGKTRENQQIVIEAPLVIRGSTRALIKAENDTN